MCPLLDSGNIGNIKWVSHVKDSIWFSVNNKSCGQCESYIDGLLENCSISSVQAVEILQSCTKPSMYCFLLTEQWDLYLSSPPYICMHRHTSSSLSQCWVLRSAPAHAWSSRTHWGSDKMADVFQTTFPNAFSWMKMYEFQLRFHWNLFPRVQLAIFQHWFR